MFQAFTVNAVSFFLYGYLALSSCGSLIMNQ